MTFEGTTEMGMSSQLRRLAGILVCNLLSGSRLSGVMLTGDGTGNPFMSRQSYLANEIRWGYQFVRCIHRPRNGGTNYIVDTAKCAFIL